MTIDSFLDAISTIKAKEAKIQELITEFHNKMSENDEAELEYLLSQMQHQSYIMNNALPPLRAAIRYLLDQFGKNLNPIDHEECYKHYKKLDKAVIGLYSFLESRTSIEELSEHASTFNRFLEEFSSSLQEQDSENQNSEFHALLALDDKIQEIKTIYHTFTIRAYDVLNVKRTSISNRVNILVKFLGSIITGQFVAAQTIKCIPCHENSLKYSVQSENEKIGEIEHFLKIFLGDRYELKEPSASNQISAIEFYISTPRLRDIIFALKTPYTRQACLRRGRRTSADIDIAAIPDYPPKIAEIMSDRCEACHFYQSMRTGTQLRMWLDQWFHEGKWLEYYVFDMVRLAGYNHVFLDIMINERIDATRRKIAQFDVFLIRNGEPIPIECKDLFFSGLHPLFLVCHSLLRTFMGFFFWISSFLGNFPFYHGL